MQLASKYLAQGPDMIYLDEFSFDKDVLICNPKFEGLCELEYVPVSKWVEAICQNGELFCRLQNDKVSDVVLANVEGVSFFEITKKETKAITFRTKKIMEMKHYFVSAVSVLKDEKELFSCKCTHYFAEGKE